MKEIDKKKTPTSNRTKRSGRTDKRDSKPHKEISCEILIAKETEFKASHTNTTVSDSNAGKEPTEVYEKVVIHYVDDVNRFEEQPQDSKAREMVVEENKDDHLDGDSRDLEKESREGKEEDSDCETINDSVSSQADSLTAEEEKVEKSSRVAEVKKKSSKSRPRESMATYDRVKKTSEVKEMHSTPRKSINNGVPFKSTAENISTKSLKDPLRPSSESSESSEGVDDKPIEDVKEVDILDEASNGTQSVTSDDETNNADGIGEHDKEALDQKIGEMETRIEKLEEELREVAALEISLYSVVPEHGSSAHKVHTPARRLSRLYIHACKHWTQDKRATVARNTVSGLVLIAKSCGNDVPRLTFWLSNTVVLREIISQAFGNSCNSGSVTRLTDLTGGGKRSEGKSPLLKWKGAPGSKQVNIKPGFIPFLDDWQETRTFTTALEKVESWIFSRIVESVWWQTITPNMQSPSDDLYVNKSIGRLLGPALGDQQQGSFSINLWKNAFQDAFQRLCPVRAGGHECGCLPVLARMVMEQCVTRLDVAMFNAILRESAHEIPTDPISDPILDSKVLPIPAGDLSFGSGAQLKNSVGNWSRWLTDLFGLDSDDPPKENQNSSGDNERSGNETKSFHLLNALSDLLMLPKDMLMNRSIRKEVCPSIGLPLVKRILCNFTPDEFCPDPVPGAVLEALNAESVVEQRLSGDSASSFPFPASPVVYVPPSPADVAEKVAEAGGKSHLARNASLVQKKGYTSDEELEELDSPLRNIMENIPHSSTIIANGNGVPKEHIGNNIGANARYELLREVWSA